MNAITNPAPTTDLPGPVTPPVQLQDTGRWLIAQRNAGRTPDDVARRLVASGWAADAAAAAALRSLRSRDHQRLLYSALGWSAAIGATCLGTGLHQALAGPTSMATRQNLAMSFTAAVVMIPIAFWCARAARRIERDDPFVIWSPTRRTMFGWLAGVAGSVGLFRSLVYVYQVIASIVGARTAPLAVSDFVQVVIALSVAGPMFAWGLTEWRRSNVAYRSLSGADASAEPEARATSEQ